MRARKRERERQSLEGEKRRGGGGRVGFVLTADRRFRVSSATSAGWRGDLAGATTWWATRRQDVMINRGGRRGGAELFAFLPVVFLGSRRIYTVVLNPATSRRRRRALIVRARRAPQLLNADTKTQPAKKLKCKLVVMVVLVVLLLLCDAVTDGRGGGVWYVHVRRPRPKKTIVAASEDAKKKKIRVDEPPTLVVVGAGAERRSGRSDRSCS
jgi:hypothetical protein